MDENKPSSPAEKPEKKRKKSKKRGRLPGRVISLLLLLAVAGGLLYIMLRDGWSDREEDAYSDIDSYTYETGSEQIFAAAGNGFAVASSSSVQLMDEKGKTVYKALVNFETPAVFGWEKGALFCDIGGTDVLYAFLDGTVTELETSGEILSASINGSGWFTVISQQAGYKGLVEVYDAQCQLVYRWWSGTGYALRAQLSSDGKRLAVLTVGQEGSEIHFFSLASEDELPGIRFPGELLFDLAFMSGDVLCAVGEENLYFAGTDATLRGSYSLSGRYLSDYDLSSGEFVTVCTNVYRTGAGGTLTTLDSSGNTLGSVDISRDIIAVRAQGKQLLVVTGGDISLYDEKLNLSKTEEQLMTARDALLLPNGDILLLSANAAEKFKF